MDLHWLSPGDNAWQMTAATLVGLMSVPGLVVLYGGVMQKRWSVNSMMMAFVAFALVLVVWVLYGFKMGFGSPVHIFGAKHGFFANLIGEPGSILNSNALLNQGNIPNVGKVVFPQSTLAYFQIVFAAITPILALGSVHLDERRLHGQRLPDLGRRLLRAARRLGLLWRVRHPPVRRRVGLRRRCGHRAEAPARP